MKKAMQRSSQVEDSVYVILGAYGGIGSELSRQLTALRARLVLGGRDQDRLQTLASELGAHPYWLDATRFDEVESCVAEAVKVHGQVDGIVNCVGSVFLKQAHMTGEEAFTETVATNLGSAFATVRAGAKVMRKQGGAILLMSSAAARVGLANHEAIAAAKAGVNGLVRSAAATYARYGIRVNAVAPGLVRTPATEKITANETSERVSIAMHPAGRLGRPEDIVRAIVWLLTPGNDWVTGQVINVDGGLATVRPRQAV